MLNKSPLFLKSLSFKMWYGFLDQNDSDTCVVEKCIHSQVGIKQLLSNLVYEPLNVTEVCLVLGTLLIHCEVTNLKRIYYYDVVKLR